MKQLREGVSYVWHNSMLLPALLVLVSISVSAGQVIPGKRISVSMKAVSLQEAFVRLEKLTGYTYLYRNDDVQGKAPVSIEAKDLTVTEVLTAILKPARLSYEVDGKVIIIKSSVEGKPLPGSGQPRVRVIRGRVTDKDNHPLPGATITVKGGGVQPVQANENGEYILNVPAGMYPVLVFSFVGMEPVEKLTDEREIVDVRLSEAATILQETVIVGAYGLQQKRSDMVGSAYQVSSAQIKNLPVQRVDNLLEGLVPGLQIDFNSDGAVSTRPRMDLRVRGTASMSASNEPLWIVDGIRVFTGDRTNMIPGMNTSVSPLSYLSPDDIESITVLKDATMASIYGADGANGVILITTKKGRRGDPSFRASARYGLAQINKSTLFKTLDAAQYMELAKESFLNLPENNDLTFFPFQDLPGSPYSATATNWTDVFYGTGTYLQSNIGVDGGSEKVNYFLSGEYFATEQTVKGNLQQRFALRSNLDFSLAKNLSLTLNVSASYNQNDIFNPGNDYYEFLPIVSPYNADGSFRQWIDYVDRQMTEDGQPVGETKLRRFFNSVAEREQNEDVQRTFYSVNNLTLEYGITEGLTLSSQAGANFQSSFENRYHSRGNWSGWNLLTGEQLGKSYRSHMNILVWSAIQRLNFSRKFGRHRVGGVAGMELSAQQRRNVGSTGFGFANDHIREVSYAAERLDGTSSAETQKRASFFGQGNYSYDDRYFFSANWRQDGNSDFGEDVRWAKFYSVGGSWNIHNESFYSSELINVLKLKGSFGTNGNSRLGNNYAAGLYTYQGSSNYAGISGTTMSKVWNRALSWEQSYMTNVGIRVNVANRVDVEVEAYNKRTVDLLTDLDVSRTTGDNTVVRNLGETQNRGLELTVETVNLKKQRFSWTTSANMSHNRNRLVEMANEVPKERGNQIWMEGQPLGTYYLVRWAGVDPRDGVPLWYDARGNLTRTYNVADRVPYRNEAPLLTGGVTNNVTYDNWSLNVLAVFGVGGYGFTSFGRNVSSDGYHLMEQNQSVNQLDRWRKPGDLALSPKPLWQQANANSTRNSTRYLYNKTFLRMKNVALSYRLSRGLLNRLRINDASVNLLVDNIGIWTPYDQSDRNSYKQAISGYPMETTVSLGINVSM